MKKLFAAGVLAGSLCLASLCQAAEPDIATLPLLDESRPVVTETPAVQVQEVQPVKAVRPPLQVMITAAAPSEEQAVALAKQKAVCKAIEYLQEQDYAHAYRAEVFSLADDCDKYIIAYNARIDKAEAGSLTLAVRVDLNRELLQESVACYRLIIADDGIDVAGSSQNAISTVD